MSLPSAVCGFCLKGYTTKYSSCVQRINKWFEYQTSCPCKQWRDRISVSSFHAQTLNSSKSLPPLFRNLFFLCKFKSIQSLMFILSNYNSIHQSESSIKQMRNRINVYVSQEKNKLS
uniref:Uncharacterized protein n=1 Tax=Cacopsylla melanoneura TaxID=428564 RepID=A0A8D8Y0G5_9HEMI